VEQSKFNQLFGVKTVAELVGDRFAFVVAGPGGTGKSTLLGSMAKKHKTLLLATLPREAASWLYRELNVDTIPLWEDGWYTTEEDGTLPADIKVRAFGEYLKVTEALRDDDVYDAVVLDNGTELAELAWHQAMLTHGVVSPAYIQDKRSRWLPYETLSTNLDQAIKNLVSLTGSTRAKRPKFIGISWHVQPPKDDQVEIVGEGANSSKVQKASADNKAEGVEYEGKVLPMIRGGFRRKLSSQVDAFIYTDIHYDVTTEGTRRIKTPRYVLQVQPDEERHAKIPGPMSLTKYIPNDFEALYRAVKEGKQKQPTKTQAASASPVAQSTGPSAIPRLAKMSASSLLRKEK
jgi:hypothetical protein